jgi:hypothetical protein
MKATSYTPAFANPEKFTPQAIFERRLIAPFLDKGGPNSQMDG